MEVTRDGEILEVDDDDEEEAPPKGAGNPAVAQDTVDSPTEALGPQDINNEPVVIISEPEPVLPPPTPLISEPEPVLPPLIPIETNE